MQTLGFEQRLQQRVFVFAVSVLIVEYVCGGVRLVASDSQRKAYVAKVLCDEIVKRFGLLQIRVKSLGQSLCLATDFHGGDTAIFFKTGVPASDFFPGPESRQLNVRPLVVPFLLFFLFVLLFLFLIVLTFQVRIRPVIDAPSVLLGNLRIHSRLVLELHRTVRRRIDIDLLVEHDVVLVEVVFGPELASRQGRVNHRDQVIFQHFARTQPWHRNMLLAKIGIDRRFARHRGAQVLHRVVARLHDAAIFLQNPYVGDLHPLVGRVVSHLQLTPLLDASLTLHSNAGNGLSAAGAIALKTVTGPQLLDDERLLRIVRFLLRKLVRCSLCWLGTGGFAQLRWFFGLRRSVSRLTLTRLWRGWGNYGETQNINKETGNYWIAHKSESKTKPCAVCIVSREVAQLGPAPASEIRGCNSSNFSCLLAQIRSKI